MMFSVNPDTIQCSTPSEGAALGLLALMTGISEETWCAGWYMDLEYILWRAPSGKYGVTERQASLLPLLHQECDGWWMYDLKDGPRFVTTDVWMKHLEVCDTSDAVAARAR